MKKDITKIEIGLENCEIITIDGRYIDYMSIKGISRSIYKSERHCLDHAYCNHLSMIICENANNTENMFLDTNIKPFDRIKNCPDIVEITIFYFNGDAERIYVDWNENNDCENKYQKTYITEHGDMFILIDSKLSLEDVDLWLVD